MNKFIYKYEAMSTPCELILYAKDKTLADKAAQAVLIDTKRLEKKYNYYKKDSLLHAINTRQTQELDSETKTLLQRAKKYYTLTDTIFDISIATIKPLYTSVKEVEELQIQKEKLKEFIGCEHFTIKKNKIHFDNPHTQIDLGGFVKEYAVDQAIKIIKKHKISSALVNYGGDIYALGLKPDGNLFSIGIKDPSNPDIFAREVFLENQALTTSASYERNYTIASTTYSHILSKNEYKNKPKSVSVISNNCVQSGVYSTSIMIHRDLQTNNEVIIL